jgi:small subunit ribosomal protein S27e
MSEETTKKFVKPKGIGNRFVRIKCKDCGNVQPTYTRTSSVVVCNICGVTLSRPTGGIAEISAELVGETE